MEEPPRATSFCVRMWLITTTLVICLICTCFVMVKAPEKKVEVSSTDMLLLDGVSSLWCQGQELVSTHKFNVYRFNDDNDDNNQQRNQTKTRIEIDNMLVKLHIGPRKHQYLRYFLLSGSSVAVSAVPDGAAAAPSSSSTSTFSSSAASASSTLALRQRGSAWGSANGTINVVKGKDEMARCLKELDDYVAHNGTDSDEDEDDDGDFLPIRQRRYRYLRWATRTRFVSNRLGRSTTEVSATEDDHFYILIVNDSTDHDMSVTLHISLARIRFPVDHDDIVCDRVKHCLHHIGLGTEPRLVLDIPREPDAGRSMFVVRSVCRPRVFFYALLFILIPIIMLLITGLVIKAYSTLLALPYQNRTDLRARIVRRIQTNTTTGGGGGGGGSSSGHRGNGGRSVSTAAEAAIAHHLIGRSLASSTVERRGPVVVPYSPPRQYVQVLYQIPGDQGLLDRVPTPGTPPPSYASLEKSRKLTPPVCCEQCYDRMEHKSLLPPPPVYGAD